MWNKFFNNSVFLPWNYPINIYGSMWQGNWPTTRYQRKNCFAFTCVQKSQEWHVKLTNKIYLFSGMSISHRILLSVWFVISEFSLKIYNIEIISFVVSITMYCMYVQEEIYIVYLAVMSIYEENLSTLDGFRKYRLSNQWVLLPWNFPININRIIW